MTQSKRTKELTDMPLKHWWYVTVEVVDLPVSRWALVVKCRECGEMDKRPLHSDIENYTMWLMQKQLCDHQLCPVRVAKMQAAGQEVRT